MPFHPESWPPHLAEEISKTCIPDPPPPAPSAASFQPSSVPSKSYFSGPRPYFKPRSSPNKTAITGSSPPQTSGGSASTSTADAAVPQLKIELEIDTREKEGFDITLWDILVARLRGWCRERGYSESCVV